MKYKHNKSDPKELKNIFGTDEYVFINFQASFPSPYSWKDFKLMNAPKIRKEITEEVCYCVYDTEDFELLYQRLTEIRERKPLKISTNLSQYDDASFVFTFPYTPRDTEKEVYDREMEIYNREAGVFKKYTAFRDMYNLPKSIKEEIMALRQENQRLKNPNRDNY